jgi:hypothetical protein
MPQSVPPAYVVVLRQIFPAGEASWRVPVWFFANICGMALADGSRALCTTSVGPSGRKTSPNAPEIDHRQNAS